MIKGEVSHELNSINAAGFRRSSNLAERMMRRASGETVEPLVERAPLSSEKSQRALPETDHRPIATVPNNSISTSDENTVTIENKNIHFEVAYPHDSRLMAVGLRAMSVDISEDSVSILMQDTVQLKLPKLTPLHLTVEGAPYKVCWAGGSHNFGKFKHISFVIVE